MQTDGSSDSTVIPAYEPTASDYVYFTRLWNDDRIKEKRDVVMRFLARDTKDWRADYFKSKIGPLGI